MNYCTIFVCTHLFSANTHLHTHCSSLWTWLRHRHHGHNSSSASQQHRQHTHFGSISAFLSANFLLWTLRSFLFHSSLLQRAIVVCRAFTIPKPWHDWYALNESSMDGLSTGWWCTSAQKYFTSSQMVRASFFYIQMHFAWIISQFIQWVPVQWSTWLFVHLFLLLCNFHFVILLVHL